MKVLVTGGSGFIGREVVRRLGKKHEVRLLTRKARRTEHELAYGDVANWHDVLQASYGCDAIIHLAAEVDARASWDELSKANIQGTWNVLHAAKENGIGKVVHMSSCGVTCRTLNAYGRSKLATETLARAHWVDMKVPIIRTPYVYDAGKLNALPRAPIIPVPRGAVWQLSWRQPLAQTMVNALERGRNKIYTVADRQPVEAKELAEAVADNIGARVFEFPPELTDAVAVLTKPVELAFRCLGLRPPVTSAMVRSTFEDRRFDISLAKKELGHRPADTIKTIRRLLKEEKR
jgi:nucleoside-diphosphate-sugar epimerase